MARSAGRNCCEALVTCVAMLAVAHPSCGFAHEEAGGSCEVDTDEHSLLQVIKVQEALMESTTTTTIATAAHDSTTTATTTSSAATTGSTTTSPAITTSTVSTTTTTLLSDLSPALKYPPFGVIQDHVYSTPPPTNRSWENNKLAAEDYVHETWAVAETDTAAVAQMARQVASETIPKWRDIQATYSAALEVDRNIEKAQAKLRQAHNATMEAEIALAAHKLEVSKAKAELDAYNAMRNRSRAVHHKIELKLKPIEKQIPKVRRREHDLRPTAPVEAMTEKVRNWASLIEDEVDDFEVTHDNIIDLVEGLASKVQSLNDKTQWAPHNISKDYADLFASIGSLKHNAKQMRKAISKLKTQAYYVEFGNDIAKLMDHVIKDSNHASDVAGFKVKKEEGASVKHQISNMTESMPFHISEKDYHSLVSKENQSEALVAKKKMTERNSSKSVQLALESYNTLHRAIIDAAESGFKRTVNAVHWLKERLAVPHHDHWNSSQQLA